jgi:hypothetical protein
MSFLHLQGILMGFDEISTHPGTVPKLRACWEGGGYSTQPLRLDFIYQFSLPVPINLLSRIL